jgi:hypothetical protein
MRHHHLAALLALASSFFVSGCAGKKGPLAVACEKLEIKHCKNAATSVNYEINKRITELLEQSGELQLKLADINRTLDPHISKTFLVDINRYQEIGGLTSSLKSQNGMKLDRVKVFAVGAPLPHVPSNGKPRFVFDSFSRLELTTREDSPKIKKYMQIKELCDRISVAACKVNYTGVLDGVWTKKEGEPSAISGWIEYHEIALVPFSLESLNSAAHENARRAVFKIIADRKGEISWRQIEEEVSRAVAEIK